MILVTGATGNTGRAVVTGLANAGVPVRAMVRRPEQAQQFPAGVEVAVADMDQPTSLSAALDGVHQLLLISPLEASLVEYQQRTAELARAAGVQRIVKISTQIADPDSDSLIGRWHGLAEQAVEATGVAFFHVRPCNFMQNLDTFKPEIRGSSGFSAPLGNARISLVDVGDVAAVAVAALLRQELPSGSAVVTGQDRPTYAEFAQQLSAALGRPIHYEATDPQEAARRFSAAGVPAWKTQELLSMYAHLQDPSQTQTTDAVMRFTGRAPRRFSEFVNEYASQLSTESTSP